MTVHSHEEKLELTVMAFEARYENGYRYLDHCGEAIIRIRHHDRSWVLGTIVRDMPIATAMRSEKLGLGLGFSSDKFHISVQNSFTLTDGEKKVQLLGTEAEALYELITESIRAPETVRIGVRYRFTAPADSLEEADRFMSRGAKSPLLDVVLKSTRSQLRDSAMFYVVEDHESGYRRRVAIESQVTLNPGDPAYTGLGTTGKAAVCIDIDTFTRPESGHFQKTNLFIQNNYMRSRAIAMELFQWLKQQR